MLKGCRNIFTSQFTEDKGVTTKPAHPRVVKNSWLVQKKKNTTNIITDKKICSLCILLQSREKLVPMDFLLNYQGEILPRSVPAQQILLKTGQSGFLRELSLENQLTAIAAPLLFVSTHFLRVSVITNS